MVLSWRQLGKQGEARGNGVTQVRKTSAETQTVHAHVKSTETTEKAAEIIWEAETDTEQEALCAQRHTPGSPAAGGRQGGPSRAPGGVRPADPSTAAQALKAIPPGCGEDPPAARSTQQHQTPWAQLDHRLGRGLPRACVRHRCPQRGLGRAWGPTHSLSPQQVSRQDHGGAQAWGTGAGSTHSFWIVDELMVKSL